MGFHCCSTCKHGTFDPVEDDEILEQHNAPNSECRRFPPQIIPVHGSNFAVTQFPMVDPLWYCGEWAKA